MSTRATTLVLSSLLGSCASSPSGISGLLEAGQPVFGIFAGAKTAEQGERMAANLDVDFVFYSLERGPFDIPTMQEYMQGLQRGSGDRAAHPMALRIPPIGDETGAAVEHAGLGLDAGVAAIVFPHVTTSAEAAVAVRAMRPGGGASSPGGPVINMLIVEDRAGVENVQDIVSTPGVDVVFAGPGDLRRAYDNDMAAVEQAIQKILAVCIEHGIPCGITAGTQDIQERIEQGFGVIIVTRPEALTVGRRAAGR